MDNTQAINSNPVYKQIMADSFGGVMYNVANRNKYDDTEIKKLWSDMSPGYREASGGIMKGAFNFLNGN